jgi:hypothetical protein
MLSEVDTKVLAQAPHGCLPNNNNTYRKVSFSIQGKDYSITLLQTMCECVIR